MLNSLDAAVGRDWRTWGRDLHRQRPSWVVGSLSESESNYLLESAFEAKAEVAVELGTGSGFSTSVLCHALHFASQVNRIPPDFSVISYDISPTYYADESKRVGQVTRELLPAELQAHVTFRHPARAADFRRYHDRSAIKFLFIDADHMHPWPTLDLLAALDYLAPGATVLLHDINLPLLYPQFRDLGAKHLFDGLDIPKDTPTDVTPSNIGRLTIPNDKARLRTQLHRIVYAHEWQVDVPGTYLAELEIDR